MNEGNTSHKTHKKNCKYIVFLGTGILAAIIVVFIEAAGLSNYTIPVLVEHVLCLITGLIVLGLFALILSKRMGGATKYWLPVLAWLVWLFLITFLYDNYFKPSNKISKESTFRYRLE